MPIASEFSRPSRSFWRSALFAAVLLVPLSAQAIGSDSTSYPQDTALVLTGSGITLTILSGSSSNSLTLGTSDFTVNVLSLGQFLLRYPGPNPGALANNGGLASCTYVSGNNDLTVTGPATVTFTPSATPVCASSSGGGGGGSVQPSAMLSQPNGGESLAAASVQQVFWSANGTGVQTVRLSLSTDSGLTFPQTIATGLNNAGSYSWTVPDISTTKARVKIEALGSGNVVLASDMSNADFTVVGTVVVQPTVTPTPTATTDATLPLATTDTTQTSTFQPVLTPDVYVPGVTPVSPGAIAAAEAAAPTTDRFSTGGYDAAAALEDTPTINVDKDLKPPEKPPLCSSGSLIKGSLPAVYFCGKDGKRYVFFNEGVYKTWYKDFSAVKKVSDELLAQLKIGGVITYKPGVRMVKIQSDPKVYVVARGGLLRWVENEAAAVKLYGARWNQLIDDVPVGLFFTYKIGPSVTTGDLEIIIR